MKTPAGQHCPHYYQDFNRGRALQECRLEKQNPNSLHWQPSDCARCPVPGIVSANASPDMVLTLTIRRELLGLRRKLAVTAFCDRHRQPIADPYIGCDQCAEERGGLTIFRQALGEVDDERPDEA
ncbi:MAG: hypothetical protein SGJ24_15895 [Chloroflexota bacterium]|nr:hypothetical protein [Chloroflexota bacterium]